LAAAARAGNDPGTVLRKASDGGPPCGLANAGQELRLAEVRGCVARSGRPRRCGRLRQLVVLPQALTGLPQQRERVGGRAPRGSPIRVSAVLLDQVRLKRGGDFVGRLQHVVDGPVPCGVVNHGPSIPAGSFNQPMDTGPRRPAQDIGRPLLSPAERGKPEHQGRRVGGTTGLSRGPYPACRSPVVIAPQRMPVRECARGRRSARMAGRYRSRQGRPDLGILRRSPVGRQGIKAGLFPGFG
jgi:hypothetical protein